MIIQNCITKPSGFLLNMSLFPSLSGGLQSDLWRIRAALGTKGIYLGCPVGGQCHLVDGWLWKGDIWKTYRWNKEEKQKLMKNEMHLSQGGFFSLDFQKSLHFLDWDPRNSELLRSFGSWLHANNFEKSLSLVVANSLSPAWDWWWGGQVVAGSQAFPRFGCEKCNSNIHQVQQFKPQVT